jgi:hypothetical protein
MYLTHDEIIDMIDCINNRLEDLTNCAMFGDGDYIEDEIERLNSLMTKLNESLEA